MGLGGGASLVGFALEIFELVNSIVVHFQIVNGTKKYFLKTPVGGLGGGVSLVSLALEFCALLPRGLVVMQPPPFHLIWDNQV